MNDNTLTWKITFSVIIAITLLLSMVIGCYVHEDNCTLEAIKAGTTPEIAAGVFSTRGVDQAAVAMHVLRLQAEKQAVK